MKAFWFCLFFVQFYSLQAAKLPGKFNIIDSVPAQKKYFLITEY
jgi:hypothetical protein